MNTLVTGLIGSGKTTYIVGEVMLPAVKRGQYVFHNVPIYVDEWERVCGKERVATCLHMLPESTDMGGLGQTLDLCKLVAGGNQELPTILVIDEAPDFLDSWGDKYAMQRMIDFLRFARHMHIEVYLLSQHPDMLQSRVRSLIGRQLVVADGRKFRVPNTGIFAGACFWNWGYWLCWEMSPSGKNLIRFSRSPKNKSHWRLFDSFYTPGRYKELRRVDGYKEEKKAGWKMTWMQKAALYLCVVSSTLSVGMVWSRQFEPRIVVKEVAKQDKVASPGARNVSKSTTVEVVPRGVVPSGGVEHKEKVVTPLDNRIRMLPGGVRCEYACPEQVWRDPDTVVWKFGKVRWLKGASGEYGKIQDINEQAALFESAGAKTLVRRVDDPERATVMRRVSLASVPLPYSGNK